LRKTLISIEIHHFLNNRILGKTTLMTSV